MKHIKTDPRTKLIPVVVLTSPRTTRLGRLLQPWSQQLYCKTSQFRGVFADGSRFGCLLAVVQSAVLTGNTGPAMKYAGRDMVYYSQHGQYQFLRSLKLSLSASRCELRQSDNSKVGKRRAFQRSDVFAWPPSCFGCVMFEHHPFAIGNLVVAQRER